MAQRVGLLGALWALSIALSATPALAKGTYTVVAPRTLRPGASYNVAVTTQGASQPTSVTLEVSGRQDSGGNQRVVQTILVEPFATRTARLDVPDLGPGAYRLTARGQGGVDFENSTALDYVHKSYSVWVQTDRAVYKPGHLVQFRVLALNPLLKPSITHPLDIFIADGKGHRVKEWRRVPLSRGVFSGELLLSESPVLGDWNITASIQDQHFVQTFQVAEYVLPNFEVTVDVPKDTTYKDGKISATIRARYPYGKPVRGEATVTAYPAYVSDVLQPVFEVPVRKVVPINGKVLVEFDVEKELKLQGDFTRDVRLEAVVEEALTLRRQNVSTLVTVHKYKYTMELIRSSRFFKPGLRYTAYVKVAHHDGSPVQDDVNPVTFRYGYTWDTDKYTAFDRPLPRNGIVRVDFYPPADAVTLGIEARYLDLTEWFSTIDASISPSGNFLQASLVTQNPKVNEDVEVEVNSTTPLSHLSYQVLGRGDVVVAHSLQLAGQRTARFRFLATHPMAPLARVLVSSVLEGGEVLADVLDVDLDGVLQNFVDVSLAPASVEPGRDVELRLQTRPNSYVGILAVDQSALQLGAGNDITEEKVREDLLAYGHNPALSAEQQPAGIDLPLDLPQDRAPRRAPRAAPRWRPGAATAQEVFDSAGAVILTNGYVLENLRVEQLGRGLGGPSSSREEAGSGTTTRLGGQTTDNPGAEPGPRTRRHFPETWLWDHHADDPLRAHNRAPHRHLPVPGLPVVKPDLGPAVAYLPATRPPLAGPYAFSRIPHPVWNHPKVFLTKSPAPTWLFTNVTTGADGRASLKRAVPDSITSWVVTAFSVDPLYGLGLTPQPSKLTVFRPFFVTVDLPYSVVRGEAVSLPVVVFNYMDRDVTAEVTLEHGGDLEFADVSNEVNSPAGLELFRRKRVAVKAQDTAVTSFMVIPREVGSITIKVTVSSERAGDSIERQLLVKPEGDTVSKNKAILIDLRASGSFKTNVTLHIPKYIVPGSERIEVSAVGDLLGPTIPNLDKLVRMPHGCGEQNMITFVPNVVILDYLKNSRQLSQAVESRARGYMEQGYQQQLTYRHKDGSFSAFGESDPSGSTWLTAFVARAFRQGQAYIPLEERVVDEALQWLAEHQAANGSFPELGTVVHASMQGGAARGLALTAYQFTSKYRNTINKAVDYLVRNIGGAEDEYAIAVTTYALHLALHPTKDAAFNLLESKARSDGELKWWNRTLPAAEDKNPWHTRPNALSVEMTSYALLTYLQRGLVADAMPILHWLLAQRNANGGFVSTQDTVLGLQALSELLQRTASPPGNVVVSFSYRAGAGHTSSISINRVNSMILQKQEVPRGVREVQISATGSGVALVQVSYSYNVNVTGAWPLFTLDPQVDKNSDANHLQLSICAGFVPNQVANASNMAVMEVTLPSGFTADRAALPSLEQSQHVRRVETRDQDTVVVLYFDKMVRKEYCPTVSAFRTHRVARQHAAPVVLYDYYDQSRRARVFYEPRKATLCDICDDCPSSCAVGPRTGERLTDDGTASEPDGAGALTASLALLAASLAALTALRNTTRLVHKPVRTGERLTDDGTASEPDGAGALTASLALLAASLAALTALRNTTRLVHKPARTGERLTDDGTASEPDGAGALTASLALLAASLAALTALRNTTRLVHKPVRTGERLTDDGTASEPDGAGALTASLALLAASLAALTALRNTTRLVHKPVRTGERLTDDGTASEPDGAGALTASLALLAASLAALTALRNTTRLVHKPVRTGERLTDDGTASEPDGAGALTASLALLAASLAALTALRNTTRLVHKPVRTGERLTDDATASEPDGAGALTASLALLAASLAALTALRHTT
ncbi:CD109 antigen [Frankliniella fusca]|uniref:TEP1-F n=1 Tax=Frankliniella fusca TaxID=407009 RepID=A0AAE1HJV8_9NEOP|nr:CD109 antigen [Frankliniella fusca]